MDSSRIVSWIKLVVLILTFRLCSAPGSKGCFNCDFKTTRLYNKNVRFSPFMLRKKNTIFSWWRAAD